MKLAAIFTGLAASVAILGICLPQPSLASMPAKQSPPVVDVSLTQGGKLLGQVVDPNGAVKAKIPVSLRLGDRELAKARTDSNGYFAFSGLRGGVYQVVAAKGAGAYRVWAERTAPPTAERGALVISGQDLVRGQGRNCRSRVRPGWLKCQLANPWIVAGIVATAVSVPVGIHNSSSLSGPSSP